MAAEISPVNAPSLAHAIFCAPTRMGEPLAASTAAARFVKGGQITISQCSDFSTNGRNFSRNAVVSAGVLYIFQLPAMTGFLIIFALKNWRRFRSPDRNLRLPSVRYRIATRESRDSRRALLASPVPVAARTRACGRWPERGGGTHGRPLKTPRHR